MSSQKSVSRRGFLKPALGFLGGAFVYVFTFGCGGKKSAVEAKEPAPTGEPPAPVTPVEPAAPAQTKMTDEQWDAEVGDLLKHYKVVNEPETRSRSRGFDEEGPRSDTFKCQDTGQGHIDRCEEKLTDCQDSVLCDSALTGGCKTANFCKLANYGECPNHVKCASDIVSD